MLKLRIKSDGNTIESSLEIMSGNKINLNAGDIIKVDCSVADKVSVIMSYMEIT